MMKILVDTDCGVDDSIALLLALLCEDCEVVGVTCVHGNTSRDHVLKNVARVLKHTGKAAVPIFSGCAEPMVAHKTTFQLWEGHGPEGLGSAPPETDIPAPVPGEHAAAAISRLSRECEGCGGLNIVALGPLTNIALAVMLDPTIPERVATLTVMGGTSSARGNYGLASEFNFAGDPEAAKIVFERFKKVRVMPWETMDMSLTWEEYDELFSKKTELSEWVSLVLKNLDDVERDNPMYSGVYLPDACAMHSILRPESVTKAVDIYGEVETSGEVTRGGIFYDWYSKTGKAKNVYLIQNMDIKRYVEDLRNALQKGSYKL